MNSSVSLATLKGEKMLGMHVQTESYSTSARTPTSEDFGVSLPSLFLLNCGTGFDTSQLFQTWVETTMPVLILDDY